MLQKYLYPPLIITKQNLSKAYIDGLAQDCSNTIVHALELLLACTELLICKKTLPAPRP